jgi:hypothetical protein
VFEQVVKVRVQANGSRGETLLYFAESSRGERMDEILGRDFVRFREPSDLSEVQISHSVGVERISSSGRAAPLIQVSQGRWIVHESRHLEPRKLM